MAPPFSEHALRHSATKYVAPPLSADVSHLNGDFHKSLYSFSLRKFFLSVRLTPPLRAVIGAKEKPQACLKCHLM